jgi:hypothetical protein
LIVTLRSADGTAVVERMWVHITGYTDDGYEGVLTTSHARRASHSASAAA